MRKLYERCIDTKAGKFNLLPVIFLLSVVLSVSACGESAASDSEPALQAETEEAQVLEQEVEEAPEQEPAQIPEEQTQAIEPDESLAEPQSDESLFIEELANRFEIEDFVEIPDYSGDAYTVINDNTPLFPRSELPLESFEYYSELDELGRCGIACANVGQDIMPTKEREGIGQVKPSGWHTVKYDHVDGKYLYNRCHLIGYQLSAENANEKNLITGTRYFNVTGMLPFENMVADYVKETGNHVLYRVTPVFDGEDLLAYGVLMEGWSVEDEGDGVCFNVFVYNVQPGVAIDYATGESSLEETGPSTQDSAGAESETGERGEPEQGISAESDEAAEAEPQGMDYILNTNTKKFHYPDCRSVRQMAEKNKQAYTGNREDVIRMGYEPCKNCNP